MQMNAKVRRRSCAGVLAAAQQAGGGRARCEDELHCGEEHEEARRDTRCRETHGARVKEVIGERPRSGREDAEEQRAGDQRDRKGARRDVLAQRPIAEGLGACPADHRRLE